MTEKLYYADSHLRSFDASVISCREARGGYEVELDATAFFPEGGGQCADTGTLGGARVLDVQERGGHIFHLCGAPLSPGQTVRGELDWEKRFRNMQSHSGEHIVSGLVHNRFGFDNVGFHMGEDGMIVDFSGYVSPEELREIELAANETVWQDREITALYPAPDELSAYNYRSKLELTENVRLVKIEGVDLCACCAPHVSRTGEVGLIRILESQRRKDGVRIRMIAGKSALLDYLMKEAQIREVSGLLSAKTENVGAAVGRLYGERDALAYRLRGYELRELDALIAAESRARVSYTGFFPAMQQDDMLRVVKGVSPFCSALAAVFSGSDEDGYRFIIASGSIGLRERLNGARGALNIKGGGSDAMVQGSMAARRADIESAIGEWIK